MRTKTTLEPQMLRTMDQLSTTLRAQFLQHFGQKTTHWSHFISCENTLYRQHMPHILTVLREECVRREQIKYSELITVVSGCLMLDMRLKNAEGLLTQFIENWYMQEGFNGLGDFRLFIFIVDILSTIYGRQQRTQEIKEVLCRVLDRGTTISLQNRVSMQLRALSSTE